jgi:aryl-alcohol dehydrogenase-like predicted oxidoreductase
LRVEAVDLGINFIDTAAAYGTEGVIGRALTALQRDQVVISTKSTVRRDGGRITPKGLVANIDNSLRVMRVEHVDVFNLHGVQSDDYGYALETLAPVLDAEKRKGKIRHIGITEAAIADHTNEMLKRALRDPVWEVFMVAFHMMHQGARTNVFAQTQAKGIGTLLMFAVRGIFADPPRVAREVKELAAKGLVDPSLAATDDPLGFLIHDGGASNLVEAAYRYARHEPGVDVVLFGTGDAAHLRSNVASLLKPPLPDADRAKLAALFGHLSGIGLDDPGTRGHSSSV